MLPKYKVRKEYIYDRLHRAFVCTCMTATVITGIAVVYQVYTYIRHVRPLQQQLKLKTEEELLSEGKPLTDMADQIT